MKKNTKSRGLSKEATKYIIRHFTDRGFKNKDIASLMRVDPSVVSKIRGDERPLTMKHVQNIARTLKQSFPLFVLATFPEPSMDDKSYGLYCEIRERYVRSDLFRVYLAELERHVRPAKRKIRRTRGNS